MASRGYSLAAVCGLLIVVVSLIEKHEIYGVQASVVVVRRPSYPMACGIFLDQRLNQCPLHWQVDS